MWILNYFDIQDSKNNSRKNKRPLKPNRFDSEPYEKAHKKIKLNNEEFYEDVSQGQHYQNNTNEQIGKIKIYFPPKQKFNSRSIKQNLLKRN